MPPLLSRIQHIPFLKYLIPLSLGILLQENFPHHLLIPTLFISGFLLLLTSFCLGSPVQKYKYRSLFGAGIFLIFTATGCFCLRMQIPGFTNIPQEEPIQAIIRLDSDPEEKTNSRQAYATLLSDSVALPLLLYLPKDSIPNTFQTGDILICRLYVREIQNSGNPYAFNFRQFMLHKGIRYAANAIQYIPIRHQNISPFKKRIVALRQSILIRLQQLFPTRLNQTFMSTVLLGYRQYLPDEIRNDFSRSGLSHILAVSGLHTGILFMIVMILLSPLRLLHLKKLIYVITLFLMWGYALLTGLPASVVRAVCMISVFLFGKLLYEQNNPLNALFIAAFFMLLVCPDYLFEVGFQLSFLAVLSILIYQPILRKIIPTHPVINPVLNILIVSLAAQILTLPVSVYYFHIVPVWFLPANLIIIPLLSPLILFTLIDLSLLSLGYNIPLLHTLLNDLVTLILRISNGFSRLPSLTAAYPSAMLMFLILGCLLTFTCFLLRPKAAYLITTLLLLFATAGTYHFAPSDSPIHEVILFNQRRANSIHLITNQRHTVYSPDSGFTTPQVHPYYSALEQRFRLNKAIAYYGDTLSEDGIFIRHPFLEIGGKRFCMLTDRRFEHKEAIRKPQVNYLLIGGNNRHSLTSVQKLVRFDTLILLPTLPRYRRMQWHQVCDSLQIPIYDISRNGAFRLMINPYGENN